MHKVQQTKEPVDYREIQDANSFQIVRKCIYMYYKVCFFTAMEYAFLCILNEFGILVS